MGDWENISQRQGSKNYRLNGSTHLHFVQFQFIWMEFERNLNANWTEIDRKSNINWTEIEKIELKSNRNWTGIERKLNRNWIEMEQKWNINSMEIKDGQWMLSSGSLACYTIVYKMGALNRGSTIRPQFPFNFSSIFDKFLFHFYSISVQFPLNMIGKSRWIDPLCVSLINFTYLI